MSESRDDLYPSVTYESNLSSTCYVNGKLVEPNTWYSVAPTRLSRAELQYLTPEEFAGYQKKWDDILAGKTTTLYRYSDGPMPPDMLTPEQQEARFRDWTIHVTGKPPFSYHDTLARALSLVQRMARGYDWTPDEVDALEADCRRVGITE